MLYRFVAGFGLLLLGLYVGREVAQSRPARLPSKQARAHRRTGRLSIPDQKVSVH